MELSSAVVAHEAEMEVLRRNLTASAAESASQLTQLQEAERARMESEHVFQEERVRWRQMVSELETSLQEMEHKSEAQIKAFEETALAAQEALRAEQDARAKAESTLESVVQSHETVKGQLNDAVKGRKKDRDKSVIIMDKQRAEIESVKVTLTLKPYFFNPKS